MNTELLPRFQELYEAYKLTPFYQERVDQFIVVPVFREIIQETLKNEPLTNGHLTGLIQLFKYDCSDDTFDRYLALNISDSIRRNEISAKANLLTQPGYTGAGLRSIDDLDVTQLAIIKTFLLKAFEVETIEEAIALCTDFDKNEIPWVKSGIYSPWLYYMNSKLFPIINNTHTKFRDWIGIPSDYSSCIKYFNELKTLVGETDLGVIDMFAYKFTSGDDFWDVDHFIGNLHNKFRKIWRCATSGYWNVFREKNILSVNWLEGKTDYSILKDFGDGKMVKKRWVNELKQGNLIVILDKYKYYGVAVAKTSYKFKENDVEFGGKLWPCIEIVFLHELKTPVNHEMTINHTNPATFFELEGLSFSEKDTFKFLRKSFPEAISKIDEYMGNVTPNINQPPTIHPSTIQDHTNNNLKDIPMNTILYGPPGTGKTYSTVDESLKILDPNFTSTVREEMKKRFSEFQKEQRVFFTTFHQNMAYEDFIEGIKPVEPSDDDEYLEYEVQDGLFMKACIEATFNYIQSNFQLNTEVKNLLAFNDLFDYLYDKISVNGPKNMATKSGGQVTVGVTMQGNFTVNHQGSTKPYTVSKDRLSKLYAKYPNPDQISNVQNAFRNEIGGCNSTAYWSVLKEISNLQNQKSTGIIVQTTSPTEIIYEDKRKIVQQFWDKKDYTVLDNDQSLPYVFIIDEINRGNVAQIFGELITLIEDDKRMGKKETIYAELPYSKHSFSIPPNLYIIGTMNTADRSVEALDTALRRRFAFIPKMPIEKILNAEFDNINLEMLLTTINKRLRILKDCDHTIGHGWLMGIANFKDLKKAFKVKIIPLLQEYFYNDYEKLGLVLGEKLILIDVKVEADTFADFKDSQGLKGQYLKKKTYKIKPDAKEHPWEPSDFLSIYSKPPLPEQENV